MSEPVIQALDRLFDLAASDTGQARRAANFLLAWWNAQDNGGFDLADLFGVAHGVAADMAVVFIYLGGTHGAIYPDQPCDEDKIIALGIGRAHVCTPVTNAPMVCRLQPSK